MISNNILLLPGRTFPTMLKAKVQNKVNITITCISSKGTLAKVSASVLFDRFKTTSIVTL